MYILAIARNKVRIARYKLASDFFLVIARLYFTLLTFFLAIASPFAAVMISEIETRNCDL